MVGYTRGKSWFPHRQDDEEGKELYAVQGRGNKSGFNLDA